MLSQRGVQCCYPTFVIQFFARHYYFNHVPIHVHYHIFAGNKNIVQILLAQQTKTQLNFFLNYNLVQPNMHLNNNEAFLRKC